jgi:hypothetical protein
MRKLVAISIFGSLIGCAHMQKQDIRRHVDPHLHSVCYVTASQSISCFFHPKLGIPNKKEKKDE